MNNEIDIKFDIIIECANRILNFENDLKVAKTDSEKEHLTFFIEEQKKLIKEYTNTSPEDIVSYVAGLNALKRVVEDEKDPEKKSEEKLRLATLTNELKSEVCKSISKESNFRNSQKYDIDFSVASKEEDTVSDVKPKER